MGLRLGAMSILAVSGLSACAASPSGPPTTVFRSVSLLTMTDGAARPGRTVIVQGDRIAWVGEAGKARIARGARIIDGRGLYLMPGLVDAHTHPVGQEELLSYRRHGQTTIITMGGEGVHLRGGAHREAPSMLTSFETIDAARPLNRRFYGLPDNGAGQAVAMAVAAGANFLKTYGRLGVPELRALKAAGDAQGLPIAAHIPTDPPIADVLPNFAMIAHAEEFQRRLRPKSFDADLAEAVAAAKASRITLTANIVAYTGAIRHAESAAREVASAERINLPEEQYHEHLPQNNRYAGRQDPAAFVAALRQGQGELREVTSAMHKAGVPLLTGTDAPINCYPGLCLFEEFEELKAAGLTPLDVLRAATVNAGNLARKMRSGGDFGTVEAGKRADLILLGSNPLQSFAAFSDIRGTMARGSWLSTDEIEQIRAGMRPALAAKQAVIDRYEALLATGDHAALLAFLDTIEPDSVRLNPNVVAGDALTLDRAGKKAEAKNLLQAVARVRPGEFALWNVLGTLRLRDGDRAGAGEAFRRSLDIMPRNAVAERGLADSLAPPPKQ